MMKKGAEFPCGENFFILNIPIVPTEIHLFATHSFTSELVGRNC